MTFAAGLRAILRQNPNVVMVGEIRDAETAQIAVQASLTGHLVLTTLHTNDAIGAVTRLRDIGIEPFLIASTLRGVIAQRLVRRLVAEHHRQILLRAWCFGGRRRGGRQGELLLLRRQRRLWLWLSRLLLRILLLLLLRLRRLQRLG